MRCKLIIIICTIFTLINCKGKDYSYYTVACIGDSITYGYIPWGEGKQMDEPYPLLLKKTVGFNDVFNYGISSSTLCNGENSLYPMVDRLDKIDRKCNVIIVWGGTNDYYLNCQFGEENSRDSGNVYGALYNICSYLKTNFSNSFVIFITPLPRKINGVIEHIDVIKTMIEHRCSEFNYNVLDLTYNTGFEDEINSGNNDGIHPTQAWVKNNLVPLISNYIYKHLK